MKKRALALSGLLLLGLCLTACDSFFNPFAMSGFNSKSSDTQSSEITSSSDDQSISSVENSSSSQMSASSNVSSSSFVPVEPNYVSFDIYPFNDTHGNVLDTPGEGISLSKTATALKELSKDKETIYISQGDMWQGSIESNYTRGNLVTEWMNEMGFASMTVGNHEFDWGQDAIIENIGLAEFPMLGINVMQRYSQARVSYLEPSTTFTRGDAKIGVIGAIGNCLSSISSSKVQDIYFATNDELTKLVKDESNRLRNEEHCDFIIYSIHGSASTDEADYYDLSLSSGHYVDIVLEGHTHQKYAELDEAGVYHVQCAGNNLNTYQITVNVDVNNHVVEVNTPVAINLSYANSPYNNYPNDSATEALLDKYHDDYAFAYDTVGTVASRKNSTELKSKIADLYLEAGLTKWSSDYDIMLGGGYISCRGTGYLPAGQVTYAQLAGLFPFDNEIVLCSVMGYYLRTSNFIKGHSDYYIGWTPYGQSLKDDPTTIKNYDTYYLVTDTYSSDYARNHLTVIETLKTRYYARDLLAEYIKAGNWA